MNAKERIKNHAYELGADLVGIGSVERCKHAPLMMSPQGLFPGSRSVVVMAIHHPDACIELGGETHPQDIGPYDVQYLMNARLDEMSYRMGTFLERLGYNAIPIASSNIWRYNEYKDLKAIFAPDLSNIYMAVVAGLADLGYNGLALTPEYGARNRFITVITDAQLEPDPLIPPGSVCDQCMLCRKHCPTAAFDKEVDGEKVLKIEDFEYRFPNKNLWRCAWGEHFDLDLDLEIPAVVNEEVILDNVARHGRRGGEMGQCLKFCLPAPLRTWDREYSRSPVRDLGVARDLDSRAIVDRLLASVGAKGAEYTVVSTSDELQEHGIALDDSLPGAQAAITIALTEPKASPDATPEAIDHHHLNFRGGASLRVNNICYDLTRELEKLGYRSVMSVDHGSLTDPILDAVGFAPDGRHVCANTVITRAPLQASARPVKAKIARAMGRPGSLTASLTERARELGADLVGVASADRLTNIANQVRPLFENQTILDAAGRRMFAAWEPEISERSRHVLAPADYVPQAKSVMVFALRMHAEAVERAGKPPAEAAGPYAFQTYATNWVGCSIAVQLVKQLESLGYHAALSLDLLNAASVTANPRGEQPDGLSNRFAAVAAGLGWLTVNGRAATPEFGLRQRFIAVVTDAELDESSLRTPSAKEDLCASCDRRCISACPSKALLTTSAAIDVEGTSFGFNHIDPGLCDWTKRYALMKDCGFKYLGSKTDIDPQGEVTAAKLAAALPKLDPIKNLRPVVVEPCLAVCPYAREQ
jgi:epoxyqueuosine reductase QueG